MSCARPLLRPCTDHSWSVATLLNKAVGTIWRALSKPHQRRQGPYPRPLWLLVRAPSAFWPALVNQFNHTSGVTVVTPTDRPKSVRNRCVIEVFGGFVVLARSFFDLFCGCRDWVRSLPILLFKPSPYLLSSRRHLSVFIRSGVHTVFALNGKETVSISVQSHLQVHRWCIVHKQPIIRNLSEPDVSCWTWDQGHYREHLFCFLPRFTTVDWEGWSPSHNSIYDKRDNFNFHITNFPFLGSNNPSSPVYDVLISQLKRYARDCPLYDCFILRAKRLSSKLLKQGYLMERFKSAFKKFYGRNRDLIQQYEVSLSRMLNEILILDQLQWFPNWSDFPPNSWPWYRAGPSPNYEWFLWSICNGCGMPAGNANPSGHLVPSPNFGD